MAVNNIIFCVRDKEKEKKITELCKSRKLSVRLLTERDRNTAVGRLAGIHLSPDAAGAAQKEPSAPKGFSMPELMIFAGLDEERLDGFLDAYKKAGIAPVSLKAVITPYNLTWSVYRLVSELMRERAEILLRK